MVSDPICHVLYRAMPKQSPCPPILQHPPDAIKLGLAQINGSPGRSSSQPAQVICAPKPPEPTLSRTCQRIRGPGHGQANSRRADRSPQQPCKHSQRLPGTAQTATSESDDCPLKGQRREIGSGATSWDASPPPGGSPLAADAAHLPAVRYALCRSLLVAAKRQIGCSVAPGRCGCVVIRCLPRYWRAASVSRPVDARQMRQKASLPSQGAVAA